ncbi:probable serine/threonine-protein kinase drkC isoform X2 [Littorina saxatilis]|uniref:Protein kinase domain-containing protein n=1 Tax=Littorina saxatilis TaxID=31220 RepID=A0AAN9AUP3_9CAEN
MMTGVFLWLVHAHLFVFGAAQADRNPSISPLQVQLKQLSDCSVQLGSRVDDVINLEPLARRDGEPRFVTTFDFLGQPWNYSYNPCVDYDVPRGDPHSGFGDGCHNVAVCKYAGQKNKLYHYSLGIHSSVKFRVGHDNANKTPTELVYQGIKSMRARSTVIQLVCDEKRQGKDEGRFTITSDSGKDSLTAELHHHCCCPGACLRVTNTAPDGAKANFTGSTEPQEDGEKEGKKKDEGLLLIVIGSVVALVMLVALIGGLCYIKRTHLQIYSKLPVKPNAPVQVISLSAKTDFRDYEPSSVTRKLLPVLQDTMIHLDSLKMGQRLGGGIFGDTHLAEWHGITVAVKRLTLLVHENQITNDAMKLMKNEVWFLSRQRHKNIVTILGLCLDGKLPSIITEYVIGECLKDFIKVQGHLLSWPHRVRMCSQVADGMAFLHSTKPPIIHRDLRCGNLFLSDNDVVKVADFGLIKCLQPVREECPQDDCCCRRTMSACPASVRWTAPELLAHPVAKETLAAPMVDKSDVASSITSLSKPDSKKKKSIITPACDVYSFALVMWELPMCQDPFEEITEAEACEIVKHGGRPETPPSADMMPHYKELMKMCWDQVPANRPSFKQIATRLKDLGSQSRSYQKQLQNRQRMQKLQQDSVPV